MNLELDYLPFYVFVDKHFDIAAILFCNLMFAVYITCCQPQAVQQTLVLAAYAVPPSLEYTHWLHSVYNDYLLCMYNND